MNPTSLTILISALVLACPAAACAQGTVPDHGNWADLLPSAGSSTRNVDPAAGLPPSPTNDHAPNELDQIEREVRILLMPIIDHSKEREGALEDVLKNAVATIDYFIRKYRDQIPPDSATRSRTVAAGDHRSVSAEMDPDEHPIQVQTAARAFAADSPPGDRQAIVSAAAELRRIAAELEAAAGDENETNNN